MQSGLHGFRLQAQVTRGLLKAEFLDFSRDEHQAEGFGQAVERLLQYAADMGAGGIGLRPVAPGYAGEIQHLCALLRGFQLVELDGDLPPTHNIFLHSATARDHSFDVELKPGAHRWTIIHKAGTFQFACRYHPGMTGTLVVAK
jgi:hypothetical protein